MQSAARLEHNAKLKNLYRSTDPNVQEEVNELYIDSIKAKLSLLDNLNWMNYFIIISLSIFILQSIIYLRDSLYFNKS